MEILFPKFRFHYACSKLGQNSLSKKRNLIILRLNFFLIEFLECPNIGPACSLDNLITRHRFWFFYFWGSCWSYRMTFISACIYGAPSGTPSISFKIFCLLLTKGIIKFAFRNERQNCQQKAEALVMYHTYMHLQVHERQKHWTKGQSLKLYLMPFVVLIFAFRCCYFCLLLLLLFAFRSSS